MVDKYISLIRQGGWVIMFYFMISAFRCIIPMQQYKFQFTLYTHQNPVMNQPIIIIQRNLMLLSQWLQWSYDWLCDHILSTALDPRDWHCQLRRGRYPSYYILDVSANSLFSVVYIYIMCCWNKVGGISSNIVESLIKWIGTIDIHY